MNSAGKSKFFLYWLIFIAIIVTLDYASKHWALNQLTPYQAKPLTSFLNFTLVYNKGIAFSLFNGKGPWPNWIFGGLSIVISSVLLVWLYRLHTSQKLTALALSLIVAGAFGNLLDRIRFGYVIDFIDVHVQHYHWPVFNVADSAITLGAILWVVVMWREPKN